MATKWSDAVEAAVRRYTGRHRTSEFTRQGLIEEELDTIISDTASKGATPDMTLSRELQELRDRGIIEFLDDNGTYRAL